VAAGSPGPAAGAAVSSPVTAAAAAAGDAMGGAAFGFGLHVSRATLAESRPVSVSAAQFREVLLLFSLVSVFEQRALTRAVQSLNPSRHGTDDVLHVYGLALRSFFLPSLERHTHIERERDV
jgi:hypothetical protein